jgi:arabinose-5-phosphate isomerase
LPTDPSRHLPTAARVIAEEGAALVALSTAIDARFGQAVDLILAATGRVIVSGMGKSGHIARKIAATLASTGTPAHFVHPAEASHGDMGMLARGDVVLVLSKSGETPELKDLLTHTRRFAIPLIGVADRLDSALMKAADIALPLPQLPEACGIGIVPTTSTTMMLALGDALAIALMQARDFTPAHFRTFHPGGKLGAQLTRVRDLMHGGDAIPLVDARARMPEVLLTISQKGFGVAGVTDQGKLTGIITDGDLRRHMDGLLDRAAAQVMTAAPRTIAPDQMAEQALAQMNDRKITCLFVVDPASPGVPVGILHIHDCLRAGVG